MTDQSSPQYSSLSLRQRIAQHEVRRPLADRIADLEHQLLDFGDLPRTAQMQRIDERTEIENRLAELRQQRDEEDEPLDAA